VEAVNFAHSLKEYEQRGVVVLGLSTDSTDSHLKFAHKFSLPFPLLADTEAVVCQLYGVAKVTSKGNIRARRVTILIDENGKIEKIWDPVKADEHNGQVLRYLRERETTVGAG
jgi:thioredoxin-dependent peroxiredoxin